MFKSRFVSRRALLADAGKLTLSAGAIALLAGNDALANTAGADAAKDSGILNIALALEHEAIAAYQIGAESGLLAKEVLPVAVLFQSHHKAHRDALADTVRKLGGTPVAEQAMDAYVKSSKLNVAAIKSQGDVLALAQRLELGAANAYLGVIPAFGDRDLAKIAGRLAADETMHYTALTQALGGKLPSGALSFGG
ncbi:MAG TPA: ferritin-like domain-containing protein [Steroidobacteraceae bacterium]|nr:ferritin-like domain-containing protein [Steroidobacteraceae bacterium]